MFNKSKSYIAILLGGYPAATDKIMELVADHDRHLSFIYGFGVFVLYFHSKKRLNTIRQVFVTTLKNDVEMVFVFRNNKSAVRYITPRLQDKINMADSNRKNVISNDLAILKEILFMMGAKYNGAIPTIPYVVDDGDDEQQATSNQQIIDELLDKMKKNGYESLTQAEQDFLRDYTNNYNKDSQNDKDDVD